MSQSNNKSLLSAVNSTFPILEDAKSFPMWKKRAVGAMVSYSKWYICRDQEVPETSATSRRTREALAETSRRPGAPHIGSRIDTNTAVNTAVTGRNFDEDRNDVWGFIMASMSFEAQNSLSEEAQDPNDADAQLLWREIHLLFDQTDGAIAADLMDEFHLMKLSVNGNAVKHLVQMRNLNRQLAIAGEAVTDRTLALRMLKSLPETQYGQVASGLFQHNNLTSTMVCEAVRKEWRRIGSPTSGDADSTKDDEPAKALVTINKPKSTRSDKPKDKARSDKPTKHCDNHPNATGHSTDECHVTRNKRQEELQRKYDELVKKLNNMSGSTAALAEVVSDDEIVADHDYAGAFVAVQVGLVGSTEDATSYVVDSGASSHMVCTKEHMSDWSETGGHPIRTAGGGVVNATHRGTLRLGPLVLPDALYAPGLGFNLLSVRLLAKAGYTTHFSADGKCTITDVNNKVVFEIAGAGLYHLKASNPSTSLVAKHTADDILYLHRSLGHLNWFDVWQLGRSGILGSEWTDLVNPSAMNILCAPCILGKGYRLPSGASDIHGVEPHDIVHSDLWGPTVHPSIGGSRYFMLCYDDYTHHIELYFLKDKSEAYGAFKDYIALVETQCKAKIRHVRSDNGGEYTSKKFLELLATNGIEANPVPPAAHAQNGRAERVNRTVLNIVRTVLCDTQLPKRFWAEAAGYAAYVRNHIPKKDFPKKGVTSTPQELWTGRPSKLTQLRPFGSVVFVRDHTVTDKLAPRYLKAFLMGYRSYSESMIRYYDPTTRTINHTRDYIFERKSTSKPSKVMEGIPTNLGNKTPAKTPARMPAFLPLSTARPAPPTLSTDFLPNDNYVPRMSTPSHSPDPTPEHSVSDDQSMTETESARSSAGSRVEDGPEESHRPSTPSSVGSRDEDGPRMETPRPLTPRPETRHAKFVPTNDPRGVFLPDQDQGVAHRFTEDGRRVNGPRAAKGDTAGVVKTISLDLNSEEAGLLAILETERTSLKASSERFTKTHQFALAAVSVASLEVFAFLATDCPRSFREARNSPDWPKWEAAMKEELAKMEQYDVWELVTRTKDMRVLEARWVFTRKIDGSTGEAAAYRARWVAKGYRQVAGVDYNEIFASVVHKDTIRVFLAAVNYHGLFCDQVDIRAAFLQGHIREEINLAPAEGSNAPPNTVYRLKKSLYGLKQSPRCFNDELDAWFKSAGFQQAGSDPCLYTYRSEDVFLMLTVHVDDQLIAGNNRKALDEFKAKLNSKFECTDHGPVSYFLGFNVIRDMEKRTLSISQEHYMEHMLARFDMTDCKPEKTPLPANFQARQPTDKEYDDARHHPYPAIVGSIMYASSISRPDLAFPASLLARFITKWGNEHYRAAKHLLRYIRGTTDLCLTFDANADERTLLGHVDADWGGCPDTRRSTSGYLMRVWNSLVAWKSRRQPTVSLSTMEAELMAGCDAVKQALWLRRLLTDMGFPPEGPVRLFCDNQGAISNAANPGQHDRRKHIDLRANFVLENVRGGQVAFEYIPTDDNPADLLTKALNDQKTNKFSDTMGLRRVQIPRSK